MNLVDADAERVGRRAGAVGQRDADINVEQDREQDGSRRGDPGPGADSHTTLDEHPAWHEAVS